MLRRVPQPPLNPALRDPERRSFWPGLLVAVLGLGLTVTGARHVTSIGTVGGGLATEMELLKAYSASGLQFADHQPPPQPPENADPEAFARWAKQNLQAPAPTWTVRVDTTAKAACPT